MVDVAPIAVVDAVTADNTTSDINLGFEPEASVKNTLCTLADEAPAVAWEEVNVMKSRREPFVPAVKAVTNVPLPSLAVFAAAIVDVEALGVIVKMGAVFAGI
jgi:hypothetical protein